MSNFLFESNAFVAQDGYTPFMFASEKRNVGSLKTLLEFDQHLRDLNEVGYVIQK